jgi:hypothetical protein
MAACGQSELARLQRKGNERSKSKLENSAMAGLKGKAHPDLMEEGRRRTFSKKSDLAPVVRTP